jgi:UDP-glucose 4-epimerase
LVIVAVNHSLKNNIYFDVYNAASGLETEINSVTNIIKPILSNSQFEFTGNVRVGDPRNWKANIKKANQIGFYPKVKLENGIIEYYNWLLDA